MHARDGHDYLTTLRDTRNVFLDGGRVDDVTTHPAFAGAAASFARLYDHQAAPANADLMTFPSPSTGRPVNRAWQLCRTREELVERRKALTAWSELGLGMLGRSPDHVATSITGMYAGIDQLARYPGFRAEALRDYVEYARDNDLFIGYTINNPQADKSRSASQQRDGNQVLAVVAEDATGITVRGAKMLGTGAVLADELFVGNVAPLAADEQRYACSFAVPLATPGLKMLSRRSYAAAADNAFDYPLSFHFDENDALVWFDDVHVSWDRVFILNDVAASRAIWHETPAHAYHNYQSQIRFSVKVDYLAGLAQRVAQTNGAIDFPAVRASLARIARLASMVRAMVVAAETDGFTQGGYYFPSRTITYSALSFAQETYPELITHIRQLCGGGVIMLPSSVEDFADPGLASIIDATQVSPVTDATGRVKVFRLAWDSIGSEFASRHTQYEMFYGGAGAVVDANVYRLFDWDRPAALVDDALALMGTPAEHARHRPAEEAGRA